MRDKVNSMNNGLTSTHESLDKLSNGFNAVVKELKKEIAGLKNMTRRADPPLAVLYNPNYYMGKCFVPMHSVKIQPRTVLKSKGSVHRTYH